MTRWFVVALFLVVFPLTSHAFDQHHTQWTDQLQKYVVWVRDGMASEVDYMAWQKDRGALTRYLQQVSAVPEREYQRWSRNEQLAFLINAYNAFTVELVLQNYPVDSIKEIGSWFSSPWKRRFFMLFGEECSLDDIEHRMIRGRYGFDEPRIHFALVCASVGCPALLDEAYIAIDLDRQLDEAVSRFLSDRQRNRFNVTTGRLEVSSLFDWYSRDFIGFRGGETLKDFFRPYAQRLSGDLVGQKQIGQGRVLLEFLPYDWNLNDHR
ncbi:DUF547 domain-containing protein [Desulfuromonas acetoxidans]|uniref:DUF547 domain-containing protein n=1 Tax=Desulfuromonas acetoxidans (strain DSM 684 / 11070) TaxID=281689 RepID=Q1K471_DESA6|nr:DUF547 domain-containing protein [Desulfuromonas acetoxidans]EAT17232.1 conserved hypothetical protein [Desulfuromonas acetoxidans DSM 684]MBF0645880.1 DUF547 domain-containing protein [Desulfuromonas acetoxidans]NVD24178.1 DUF547 domain-containing protein [Desulfuromonas acetoxidans]NVE15049.1 DUF547 domain-containing protein [Desulfuromonas acetoxidans]